MRQVDEDRVLKFPYRGAPQTVSVIRQAALESQNFYPVRLLAEHICGRLRGKDYLSEILANHNFVGSRCRYMRDPRTVELVQAPYLVVEQLVQGGVPQLDCDDMTAFEGALHLAVGCEVRFATVAFRHMFYKGNRQYSHVFCQAREPRTQAWITCDPVAGEGTKSMLRRAVAYKFWPVA